MGKSVLRMRHDQVSLFLLIKPDGVVVRSALVDPNNEEILLLQLSGRLIPSVKEVQALVTSQVIDGKLHRTIAFSEAPPASAIIMPKRPVILNG